MTRLVVEFVFLIKQRFYIYTTKIRLYSFNCNFHVSGFSVCTQCCYPIRIWLQTGGGTECKPPKYTTKNKILKDNLTIGHTNGFKLYSMLLLLS